MNTKIFFKCIFLLSILFSFTSSISTPMTSSLGVIGVIDGNFSTKDEIMTSLMNNTLSLEEIYRSHGKPRYLYVYEEDAHSTDRIASVRAPLGKVVFLWDNLSLMNISSSSNKHYIVKDSEILPRGFKSLGRDDIYIITIPIVLEGSEYFVENGRVIISGSKDNLPLITASMTALYVNKHGEIYSQHR